MFLGASRILLRLMRGVAGEGGRLAAGEGVLAVDWRHEPPFIAVRTRTHSCQEVFGVEQ
jgi:hypothetical protein